MYNDPTPDIIVVPDNTISPPPAYFLLCVQKHDLIPIEKKRMHIIPGVTITFIIRFNIIIDYTCYQLI